MVRQSGRQRRISGTFTVKVGAQRKKHNSLAICHAGGVWEIIDQGLTEILIMTQGEQFFKLVHQQGSLRSGGASRNARRVVRCSILSFSRRSLMISWTAEGVWLMLLFLKVGLYMA